MIWLMLIMATSCVIREGLTRGGGGPHLPVGLGTASGGVRGARGGLGLAYRLKDF